MSERNEFELLLAAHANRELTAAEDHRLRELADHDAELATTVGDVDELHALFADELTLRRDACKPTDVADEADEGYRRLQRTAARAGDELRARLSHPMVDVARTPRPTNARRWWLLAAAAVVVAGLALWLTRPSTPELMGGRPDDKVLGGAAKIQIRAVLRAADPVFRWDAQVGATRYEALVEDGDGNVVAQRSAELSRSLSWELPAEDFERLNARATSDQQLFLRVVARDGAGVIVGTTGDRPITIVR